MKRQTMIAIAAMLSAVVLSAAPLAADDRTELVEYRLQKLEDRVAALETQDKADEPKVERCNCHETGVCICDPDECECPDCPAHHGRDADADGCWLKDLPDDRRAAILFVSDGCAPCEAVKDSLCDDGICCRMVQWNIKDHPKAAEQCGLDGTPAVRFIEPGHVLSSHALDGQDECTADAIRDWLAGVTAPARRSSTASTASTTCRIISRPTYRIVSGPVYSSCADGSCSTGECFTGSCSTGGCFTGGCSGGSCGMSYGPTYSYGGSSCSGGSCGSMLSSGLSYSSGYSYSRPSYSSYRPMMRSFSRCAGGRCR